MTLEIPYAELHAFPDGNRPHSGNPAGVALLAAPLDDADMLGIAQSNNLSETAFLIPVAGEADSWSLRWFTPGHEVDLCGHATMASAVWLFETGRVTGSVAAFETLSGQLRVRREAADRYVMDFPVVAYQPGERLSAVIAAMGAGEPEAVFDLSRIHGTRYQMMVYGSEAVIAGLAPHSGVLRAEGVNVVATAPGEAVDFVSRFFCPAAGIEEDPVTGSAHCTLAPYWADRLGKREMSARQIGPRPGALTVRTGASGRVELVGRALRFLDGVIRL